VAVALADTTQPPGNAGVKPGMSVGEFFPGRGYFTRMLSAVIGASGHVYAIENMAWTGALEGVLAEGRLTNVSSEALPFGTVRFPKPLDRVWITQNIMNSRSLNTARSTPQPLTVRFS
jgi:predicted methyltransferase